MDCPSINSKQEKERERKIHKQAYLPSGMITIESNFWFVGGIKEP